jgi:hypothetical protein
LELLAAAAQMLRLDTGYDLMTELAFHLSVEELDITC